MTYGYNDAMGGKFLFLCLVMGLSNAFCGSKLTTEKLRKKLEVTKRPKYIKRRCKASGINLKYGRLDAASRDALEATVQPELEEHLPEDEAAFFLHTILSEYDDAIVKAAVEHEGRAVRKLILDNDTTTRFTKRDSWLWMDLRKHQRRFQHARPELVERCLELLKPRHDHEYERITRRLDTIRQTIIHKWPHGFRRQPNRTISRLVHRTIVECTTQRGLPRDLADIIHAFVPNEYLVPTNISYESGDPDFHRRDEMGVRNKQARGEHYRMRDWLYQDIGLRFSNRQWGGYCHGSLHPETETIKLWERAFKHLGAPVYITQSIRGGRDMGATRYDRYRWFNMQYDESSD